MAILRQRLGKRQDDGTYLPVHLETSSDLVLRPDGTTIEDTIVTLTTPRSIRVDLGSTAAASFDGSANVTPGVSGVLPVANGGTGATSLSDLKGSIDLVTANTGDLVQWGGYRWVVVGRIYGIPYLALDHVHEIIPFNYTDNSTYKGSNLAARAKAFENALPASALANAVNTTVNGVTSKIFVASYEQVNGGFTYFSGIERRVCKTSSGAAISWWTSSQGIGSSGYNTGVYCVVSDGYINNSSPPVGTSVGFRPFVGINC